MLNLAQIAQGRVSPLALAVGVAKERADDTFGAAVFVAGLQGGVLAAAEARSLAPANGTARIYEIDREGGAATPDRRRQAAGRALTFRKRALARRVNRGEIMRLAEGSAGPDRQSTGRARR